MLWTRGLPYKEVQAGCDQCQKYCSNVIQRPATRQLQPMGRNSEKTDLSVYWIADLADLFKVGTYVCRGIHRSAVPGSFMFVTMTKSRHCQQHKMTDELTQGDVIFTMKRYPTDFASRWRKILPGIIRQRRSYGIHWKNIGKKNVCHKFRHRSSTSTSQKRWFSVTYIWINVYYCLLIRVRHICNITQLIHIC